MVDGSGIAQVFIRIHQNGHSEANMNTFVESINHLLSEGTNGPSWFSDHGPESGLFATLEKFNAENASKNRIDRPKV
jgi:hypothetical protein